MKWTNLIYVLVFIVPSFLGLNSIINNSPSNTIVDGEIVWHRIQDIENLDEQKFTLVDVYTDWCKVCKVMDEKTLSDSEFSSYLVTNYNLVKFNAEEKSQLKFKGKTFEYKSNGKRGYNTLAAELCGGKLAYPSFVVLDNNLEVQEVIRGFRNVEKFKAELDKATVASE